MGVLFHVPHASTVVPDHVRASIVLDDEGLARERREATDHHTDGIVGGLDNGTTIRSYVNPIRVSLLIRSAFLTLRKKLLRR